MGFTKERRKFNYFVLISIIIIALMQLISFIQLRVLVNLIGK